MSKPRRFAATLIIVIGIFSCSFSQADQSLPVTFNHVRHCFTISFPAGWAPMPAERLESVNKAAEAQHPEWKPPLLHYGYEMTNSAGLTFPPYIVIRVTETAKAPDPKTIQEDLEKSSELPQGVGWVREKPTFDEGLNAFLQRNSVSITGAPPVELHIACFLTKRSVIKMFFYVPVEAEGGTAVPIPQIVRSVQIDEELKLPRAVSGSRSGLILALLGIAVVVLVLARAKPGACSQNCPTSGLSP